MAIFKNTPPIVTSGLVLSLDAANRRSYISGSTTWNDLSGNNNSGSLVSGSGYSNENGGAIVFDGVNDYVNLGDTTSLRLGTSNFTINLWFLTTNNNSDASLIVKRQSINPFNFISLGIGTFVNTGGGGSSVTSSKKIRFGIRADNSNQYIANTTNDIIDGQWKNITLIRNSGTVALYINSIIQSLDVIYNLGTSINSNISVSSYNWSVGAIGDIGVQFLNGSIPQVQVYNRALSAAEVKQNYDALKTRFNLS